MIRNERCNYVHGHPEWMNSLQLLSEYLEAIVGLVEVEDDVVKWLCRMSKESNSEELHLLDNLLSDHHIADHKGWQTLDLGNPSSSYLVLTCQLSLVPARNIFLVLIRRSNDYPDANQILLIRQSIRILEQDFTATGIYRGRGAVFTEEFASNNEYFRLLIENSPVGFFFYNRDLIITLVNERFCEDFGFSPETVVGFDLKKVIDDRIINTIKKTLDGHSGFYQGEYNPTLTKLTLNIVLKTVPARNNKGEITGGIGVVENMSEFVAAKKALEEKNIRLRTLINSTPDFICFKDGDGKWIEANRSLIRLFELEGKEYQGKDYSELSDIVPDKAKTLQFCHETDNLAWKKKHAIRVEEHIISKEGAVRVFDVIKAPLFNDDGSRKGLVILGRDITGRKNAEREIQTSNTRFKLVAMHTNDVIYEWDSSSGHFTWYGNLKSIIGRVAAPVNIKEIFLYMPPEDRQRMKRLWKVKTGREHVWKEEFRLVLPGGEIKYLLGSGIVEALGNKLVKAYGTITNVTKEKELVQNLKEALEEAENNHSKLRSLLAVIPDLIFVFDSDGYFKDFHVESEKALLSPSSEFLNRQVEEILPPHLANLTREKIYKVLSSKGVEIYNYSIFDNGKECIYESRMVYFRENEAICIIRDVTRSKQVEKELVDAKERAEESDRLKSAFLANMSHEIRTPMNGIIGFAELLKGEQLLTENRNFYLDIIVNSGIQLLGLINDVLEISRIETGQIKLNKKEIDLAELFSSLSAFFEIPAREKDIVLKTALPPKREKWIFGDQYKLTQIFNNLISNALKYTPENGTVEFGYQFQDKQILFYVKDSGMGIKAEHHQLIFERFRQVDDMGNKSRGGAGLGLSICKNLIELMGGRIWVESEYGFGANFSFTLPLK